MHSNKDRAFRIRFVLRLFLLGFLACACSTPSANQVDGETGPHGVLEAIETIATPGKTTVVIAAPGARTERKAYTLSDPPRICVDIAANPADDLPMAYELPEGPVEKILIQGRGQGHTGVVVYVRPEEYKYRFTPGKNKINLSVTPVGSENFEASEIQPFRPGDPGRPRILDVAVMERPDNSARLSIETDQPVESNVELDGSVLLIDLKKALLTPEEITDLEAKPAGGAIQRIRAFYSPSDENVRLRVSLRSLTPYHVSREGNILMVDFDALPGGFSQKSSSQAAPPVHGALPPAVSPKAPKPPTLPSDTLDSDRASDQEKTRAGLFESGSKDYAGQKMSFDFVDTDIRNILKLLAEVANLNIVWGSDVGGKISMRLDNVPWDQALEMVLKPNGLTYQIEDEVLWVVPRSKLVDMEISEKKRKGALMAAKRLQGVFEAKVVEFIVVRHRPAADIFKMLVGDPTADPPIRPVLDIEGAESEEKEEGEEEEGKKVKIATLDLYLSYDTGTNMIIANGVRAKVDKTKELIAKLDVPERQVLIEARIVEATTAFTRDLGVQWRSLDDTRPGVDRTWLNSDGTTRFDGEFSTNAPSTWTPNIGLAFGFLTDGGLGSLALDASLALGQSDGLANIISAPKVLTVNGTEAMIARGVTQYIGVSTLDQQNVEEKTAVLSLTVTPTISADDAHVTMAVVVKDEKPIAMSGNINDYGGKTGKDIKTTLMVKSGDTVVIGGIYQKSEQSSDSGVPWLKDIPLLGYLFKAEYSQKDRTELLIFLTPSVVNIDQARRGSNGGS